MLSKPKNPKDYQNREVCEFEQAPLYLEKSAIDQTPPIAPAPKYRMRAETVGIKKEIVVDKPDGTSISAKKVMDGSAKRRNERKEILQKQLSENTTKMNIIKKSKNQQIVKRFKFLLNKNFLSETCLIFSYLMVWFKKVSKFSLIYQRIMRNLNILRDFLILVIKTQILTIRF